MAEFFYEDDADLGIIQARRVTVIGYDSVAAAHSLNLRDSGVKVVVGLPEGAPEIESVWEQGLPVDTIARAVAASDVVMVALPLGVQQRIYETEILPHLSAHSAVLFTEGYGIRYGVVAPPNGHDVCLVTAKATGAHLRDAFVAGRGVPGVAAVYQDISGYAWEVAKSYAAGIGLARTGVLQSTFIQECDTSLLASQNLTGGLSQLAEATFEVLVASGYQPEQASLALRQELQRLAGDLTDSARWEKDASLGDIREYAGLVTGPRLVGREMKNQIQRDLAEIQSGGFTQGFMTDQNAGAPLLKSLQTTREQHPWAETTNRIENTLR